MTPASDDIASQASAHSAIPAPASTHKFVPRDLPKFRDGPNSIEDTEEFLTAFERVLKIHDMSIDHHWFRLLLACLNRADTAWVETSIPRDAGWKTARSE